MPIAGNLVKNDILYFFDDMSQSEFVTRQGVETLAFIPNALTGGTFDKYIGLASGLAQEDVLLGTGQIDTNEFFINQGFHLATFGLGEIGDLFEGRLPKFIGPTSDWLLQLGRILWESNASKSMGKLTPGKSK